MSEIKEILRKYKGKINKYHIALFVFVVAILFVGDSTLYQRYLYDQKIRELRSEIQAYQQQIKENKIKLDKLQTDSESLERYAREQYLMTKPNEELYIITH